MYAYHILLCALLIISTAADDKKIAEEDWDILIKSATDLCKCSSHPIVDTTTPPDCKSSDVNFVNDLKSYPKILIVNVCKQIRYINNKFRPTGHSISTTEKTSIVTTDRDSSTIPTEPVTSPYTSTTKKSTPEISTTEKTSIVTTDRDSSTIPTEPVTSPYTSTTDESTPEISTTEKTSIVTTDRDSSTIPTKPVTSPYTSTTEKSTPEISTTEKTSIVTTDRDSSSKPTKPVTTFSNIRTTQRPAVTSQTPDTHSSPSPISNPPGGKEKNYPLSTVLLTFFCSFGAGILIAVASKMLYSRYRERTYEIPPEQELH